MKFSSSQKGFTLIEIMVSLSIFIVVATIAVGAFLKIINANKQSQALQTAMNNTDFALESMVREMRVGTDYTCYDASAFHSFTSQLTASGANNCIAYRDTYQGIAFNSSQTAPNGSGGTCNLIHAYQYYDSAATGVYTLEKAEQSACNAPIGPFIPLVSADLRITSFGVYVEGEGNQYDQPKATFIIQANAGPNAAQRTYFTIQTTASQRTMGAI